MTIETATQNVVLADPFASQRRWRFMLVCNHNSSDAGSRIQLFVLRVMTRRGLLSGQGPMQPNPPSTISLPAIIPQ